MDFETVCLILLSTLGYVSCVLYGFPDDSENYLEWAYEPEVTWQESQDYCQSKDRSLIFFTPDFRKFFTNTLLVSGWVNFEIDRAVVIWALNKVRASSVTIRMPYYDVDFPADNFLYSEDELLCVIALLDTTVNQTIWAAIECDAHLVYEFFCKQKDPSISDTIEANDYSDHQCSYIKVSNSDLDFLRGSCQDEAHGILCNDGYTNERWGYFYHVPNSKLVEGDIRQVFKINGTLDECKSECRRELDYGIPCWAYNYQNRTGQCTIFVLHRYNETNETKFNYVTKADDSYQLNYVYFTRLEVGVYTSGFVPDNDTSYSYEDQDENYENEAIIGRVTVMSVTQNQDRYPYDGLLGLLLAGCGAVAFLIAVSVLVVAIKRRHTGRQQKERQVD